MVVSVLAQGARRRNQHRQAHGHSDDDAQADTRPHNRPRAKRVIRRHNHQGIDRGGCQHESGCRRQWNSLAQQRTEDRYRRAIAHRKKESRDERRQHGSHRVRRKHARDQSGGEESLDELGNEDAQQQEGNRLQGHAHGDRRRATDGQARSGQGSLRRPHGNQRHQDKHADEHTPGARGAFRLHYTHPTTLGQESCAPPFPRRPQPTKRPPGPRPRTRRGALAVSLWAGRRSARWALASFFATLVFRYDPARCRGVSPGSIRKKEERERRPRPRSLQ